MYIVGLVEFSQLLRGESPHRSPVSRSRQRPLVRRRGRSFCRRRFVAVARHGINSSVSLKINVYSSYHDTILRWATLTSGQVHQVIETQVSCAMRDPLGHHHGTHASKRKYNTVGGAKKGQCVLPVRLPHMKHGEIDRNIMCVCIT